jgi:hypothetical protein
MVRRWVLWIGVFLWYRVEAKLESFRTGSEAATFPVQQVLSLLGQLRRTTWI